MKAIQGSSHSTAVQTCTTVTPIYDPSCDSNKFWCSPTRDGEDYPRWDSIKSLLPVEEVEIIE